MALGPIIWRWIDRLRVRGITRTFTPQTDPPISQIPELSFNPKISCDRIVAYSATCTWYGPTDQAFVDFEQGGTLFCPQCRARVTVGSYSGFMATARAYGLGSGGNRPHLGYIIFFAWLQGRCFPNVRTAAEAYTLLTGNSVDIKE